MYHCEKPGSKNATLHVKLSMDFSNSFRPKEKRNDIVNKSV